MLEVSWREMLSLLGSDSGPETAGVGKPCLPPPSGGFDGDAARIYVCLLDASAAEDARAKFDCGLHYVAQWIQAHRREPARKDCGACDLASCGFASGAAPELDRRALGTQLDRCSDRHGLPQLGHFLVRDGDATVSPVVKTLNLADPAKTTTETMNHD
jgi:hypothetical protein